MTESAGQDTAIVMDREITLVVGASADIGIELIRQVRSTNSTILAHYHQSRSKLDEFTHGPGPSRVVPVQADLTSPTDVDRLIASIRADYAPPRKIVYLAAPKFEYVRFKDMTWDTFQVNLNIQLRALFTILRSFLPDMAKNRSGKIVVVLSSVTFGLPPSALSHYVTTKYAVLGFLRSLAVEYSSQNLNINAVSPSMIETSFLEKLPPRMVELAAAQTPFKRIGTPQDVAGMIRFLLSSEADYITGANIPISGGTAF